MRHEKDGFNGYQSSDDLSPDITTYQVVTHGVQRVGLLEFTSIQNRFGEFLPAKLIAVAYQKPSIFASIDL